MELREMLLEDYRKAVDVLFDLKSEQLISNCSMEHAAIINEMLFKYTPDKESVYILCKNLHKDCFDNSQVLAAAKNAIERGISIKIAYTDSQDADVFKSLSEKIIIKKVNPILSSRTGKELNFSTNGSAIRIEDDASTPQADVIPSAPSIAQKIIALFNRLQETA